MLVYGRNVAEEFLKKNEKVRKVYLQTGFHDENLIFLIGKFKIPTVFREKKELDQLAKGVHQGIILDVVDFSYADYHDFTNDDNSFIIIPKDRGVSINATVIKTSTGAIDNIPISMVTNLSNTISDLKKNGFWIVGTDMVNSTDYREIDYSGKIALVIGNEGSGMSRMVRESCDFIARIPMYGKVNSLNASVAAGIMIYEVVRQKRR